MIGDVKNHKRCANDAGFTLIEVLAALLIFSLAIIGLSQAGAQSARAVTALDSKMLAGVVADNQLVLARAEAIEIGVRSGETTQLSRDFEYSIETSATDIPRLFRISVQVTGSNNPQILEQRIGFKSQPAPRNETQAGSDISSGVSDDSPAPDGRL